MMYKEFIHNSFDGEKSFIDYYDAWCANTIQFPANRSCVCLVLYSNDEEVGKNMSTKTLELCIGANYAFAGQGEKAKEWKHSSNFQVSPLPLS